MKRRHQANLKKRSDWFLNNSPSPESEEFQVANDYSMTVVTCGGSSICLGQSEPLASGNRCMMLHTNNSVLMSNYLTSSGPDLLTSPGMSRPETPGNYSMMSQAMEAGSYCSSSLYNSTAQIYDLHDSLDNNLTLSSNIDPNLSMDGEAPNSVPLIRRLLPSRSSTNSRKTSMQQECPILVYHTERQYEDDYDDEEEEDDDEVGEFILDDTQSDCC